MKFRFRDFIYLFFFLGLSALILIEGRMPSSQSSGQSKIFSWLFDWGPKDAEVIPLQSITIDGSPILYIGEEESYSVAFYPENATDKRISYSLSGDTESVKNLGQGKLSGIQEGTITLTATSLAYPNLKDSIEIQVVKEPLTELHLAFEEDIINEGMTFQPIISSNLSELDWDMIEFHFSNEEILQETEEHYLRALEPGDCSIYAVSVENPEIRSETISLHIEPFDYVEATSMEIEIPETFYANEAIEYNSVFNADCSDRKILVYLDGEQMDSESSSLSIPDVGIHTLRFQSLSNPEIVVEKKVDVQECQATSITASEASIQYGQTIRLSYQLESEKEGVPITYPEVGFSSDNENIASIDDKGYLVGYSKGTVNITVYWKRNPEIKYVSPISITSIPSTLFDTINYWARKIVGHFSLFLVTGFFAFLFFDATIFKKRNKWLPAIICFFHGALLAGLSEFLQIGMQGRGPAFQDCLIDMAGYMLAVMVLWIIVLVHRHRKKGGYRKYLLEYRILY